MQNSAHSDFFMCTYFCVHECARKTILRARKSVHTNIKFIEPCFYLTPLPCPPQSGRHVYHPYIYYKNGWWNFSFFAGIKWVGFPSRTMRKNHKDFLGNPKQICVKLYGIKWKTFGLASWKQSELVDWLLLASQINFLLSPYFTVANVTVWWLINIVSELPYIQNKQEVEASSGQLARKCKQ